MTRPNPLGSSRGFRRLWIARTISQIGDGIALVALVLLVQGAERSGVAVGVLLIATSAPRFLGPFAGAIVDRVDQRALMIACDLGSALVFFVVAAFEPGFAWLLVLVVVAAALDTLFTPAGRSAVPALVEPDALMQANAWMGTSMNLKIAAGTMLGGVLVSLFGARGAIALNATTFLVSALVLAALPPLRAPVDDERPPGVLGVGVQGLRYVWRTPALRWIVGLLFLGVAFAGVDNVALVFLVRETLGGGPVAFGAVTASYGVGMIVASLGLSWRQTAVGAGALLSGAWFVSGAGTVLTGLAPLIVVAAIAQAVAGFGNGLENVAADTLVQRSVPRAMLGRVFGIVSTAAFAGSTLAYGLGGFLVDLTTPRAVFFFAGIGVLVVATAFAIALRGFTRE